MCPLGILLIIISIMILIALFYFTTYYSYYIIESNSIDSIEKESIKIDTLKNEEKSSKIDDRNESSDIFGKEEKTQLSIISNFSDGMIHSRVMSLLVVKGSYYVYSNKKAHHVNQFEKDNRVSILSYIREGSIYKQIILYGSLDQINETNNLIIYKLSIDHRKVSITYENGPIQTTNYTYDGKENDEIITDLREVIDVVKIIKSI